MNPEGSANGNNPDETAAGIWLRVDRARGERRLQHVGNHRLHVSVGPPHRVGRTPRRQQGAAGRRRVAHEQHDQHFRYMCTSNTNHMLFHSKFTISGIIGGQIVARCNCRLVSMIGTVVCVLGLLATALAPDVTSLTISFGIATGATAQKIAFILNLLR